MKAGMGVRVSHPPPFFKGKSMSKQLICHDHSDIHDAANNILDILSEDDLSLKKTRDKIAVLCRLILRRTNSAAESGVAMEDRLGQYYSAISVLGFMRKKGKR